MLTDLNLAWRDENDPILIHGDAVVRQSIYHILFFNKNDILHGDGNEIDLQSMNFELIPFHGDMLTIRKIADAISTMDGRFQLDEELSSITPVGDQYNLHLVIYYDGGLTTTIDQLVEIR